MLQDEEIKKVIKRAIALSLVVAGVLLIFLEEGKPYALGMIFGSSMNILTFILMGFSIKKAVLMEPKRAYSYSVGNYFIRYLIYFIVLAIAALADYLSFVTTALGLFIIKIAIFSSTIFEMIEKITKKK